MNSLKNKLINFIQKWEGGFSNHPDDLGGSTMKGITFNTFKQYYADTRRGVPTIEQLKNITQQEWINIFDRYYWNAVKADNITHELNACILVSWAWGSGVSGGVKLFQKNHGLSVDGVVGNSTINAINQADPYELCNIRENYFRAIVANNPSQQVFLNGWLNRLNDFRLTFDIKKKV